MAMHWTPQWMQVQHPQLHTRIGLVQSLFCTKKQRLLWLSALWHYNTVALCVGKFLMRGHRFEPQPSKDSVNGHYNVSPHATTLQQARCTTTMRLQPEKSPRLLPHTPLQSKYEVTWLSNGRNTRSTATNSRCTLVWPTVVLLRLPNTQELRHTPTNDSHLTVNQHGSHWSSMSERTKFRLRQSISHDQPTRNGTEMPHDLLPPTNP